MTKKVLKYLTEKKCRYRIRSDEEEVTEIKMQKKSLRLDDTKLFLSKLACLWYLPVIFFFDISETIYFVNSVN